MQITDTIADLLTRIRIASTAKHPSVEIPASNMKKAICQILVDEGYIKTTIPSVCLPRYRFRPHGESFHVPPSQRKYPFPYSPP